MAVLVNPICGILNGGKYCLLVSVINLATKTLLVTELALEAIDERREAVKGLDTLPLELVFGCELLGLLDHALDVLFGEATLLVGDRDRLGLAATEDNIKHRICKISRKQTHVPLSAAPTFIIPLASISKVTSI